MLLKWFSYEKFFTYLFFFGESFDLLNQLVRFNVAKIAAGFSTVGCDFLLLILMNTEVIKI